MNTVVEFGLSFLAAFLGILWFSVIALPILYGVPRATWWALRGRVRWRVVPLYLASPIIWSIIFLAVALALEYLVPNVARYLYSSAAFAWGQWFGIIISVLRCIGAASARQALNDDFLDFVRPNLTPQGRDFLAASRERAEADVEKIVTAYGAVLAEPTPLGIVRDVRSLPYSKSDIKSALNVALGVTANAALREHLKVGYVSLGDFQELSDKEIRALQLWNGVLSKNSAGDLNIADFDTVAAEGDIVTAVQRRVAEEANSLAQELKAAGFS